MCRFCDSINFHAKNTVTAHIDSKIHIRNKKRKKRANKKRQQTIQLLLMHPKQKKNIICNLVVDAFVAADIPLEKVDKLQNWLHEHCNEGGFIPKSDIWRRECLPKLFEIILIKHKEYFCGKRVPIIIDETTDNRARTK